jgi:hypothetical protein
MSNSRSIASARQRRAGEGPAINVRPNQQTISAQQFIQQQQQIPQQIQQIQQLRPHQQIKQQTPNYPQQFQQQSTMPQPNYGMQNVPSQMQNYNVNSNNVNPKVTQIPNIGSVPMNSQVEQIGVGPGKLSVSDAFALVTIRLGRVETIIQKIQSENTLETNDNGQNIDMSIINSLVSRLENLEKDKKAITEFSEEFTQFKNQIFDNTYVDNVENVDTSLNADVYSRIENLENSIKQKDEIIEEFIQFKKEMQNPKTKFITQNDTIHQIHKICDEKIQLTHNDLNEKVNKVTEYNSKLYQNEFDEKLNKITCDLNETKEFLIKMENYVSQIDKKLMDIMSNKSFMVSCEVENNTNQLEDENVSVNLKEIIKNELANINTNTNNSEEEIESF